MDRLEVSSRASLSVSRQKSWLSWLMAIAFSEKIYIDTKHQKVVEEAACWSDI